MKKLLILAAALLTTAAVAQNKEEEAVQKKIDRSNAAIADAKKSANIATWIDRANIYIDAATIYTNKLIAGFAAEPVLAALGTASATETATVGGVEMTKYVFPFVEVYVGGDGTIQYWHATKEYIKDALHEAYNNLAKAKEVAPKDFARRAEQTVARLDNQFQTDGRAAYGLGMPKIAARLFDGSFATRELVGTIDTVSLFYAGVAYSDAQMYKEALDRFEKALSYGYVAEGSIYYYIGASQEQLDQKDKAIATFEAGFAKYPHNQAIMAGLINAYMVSGKNTDQLISIIKQAQEVDPKNASLYLVESNVWEKLGDKEKAEAAMIKATEIAPNDFNVFYNYAILKILQAETLMTAANKLDLNDTKNYNAMVEQAVASQKVAIAKLERAYEIDPNNEGAIDLLRQLYFPRRDDSPEMLQRYQFFNDLHQKRQVPAQQ